MNEPRLTAIEWGTLVGQRPRPAGCNARLGAHGLEVNVPVARITASDGTSGFGACRADAAAAGALLGASMDALRGPNGGWVEGALAFEFPLWDLMGQRLGQPVYRLLREQAGKTIEGPLRAPCYDTSLYIDDLHIDSDDEAAELIAAEADFGFGHGHRSFKIKVGRGARHMGLESGTRRDIAVVRAVREAVGPDAHLMIDANNGYNFNLARRVLEATADCSLFWIEEAFHEDAVLYGALREWMDAAGIATLIADGEGLASPNLMDQARDGVVEVVQYDIFSHGLTRWLDTGARLDGWGCRSAPHHYGRHLGNYAAGHLAAVVERFAFVEWDEVTTPGVDSSSYAIDEGHVLIPDAPGFGLKLDDELFATTVAGGGYALTV